jgi:hypothetical protein
MHWGFEMMPQNSSLKRAAIQISERAQKEISRLQAARPAAAFRIIFDGFG